MKGKDFEREVKRGIDKLKDYFVIHERDAPVSYSGAQTFGGKFTFLPKKKADFFLVSDKYPNHAIEVKWTSGKSFAFSRFNEHQKKALLDYELKAGLGWILHGYFINEKPTVCGIRTKDWLTIEDTIDKKSFNFEKDSHFLDAYAIWFERVKMKSNYYIDLSPLKKEKI